MSRYYLDLNQEGDNAFCLIPTQSDSRMNSQISKVIEKIQNVVNENIKLGLEIRIHIRQKRKEVEEVDEITDQDLEPNLSPSHRFKRIKRRASRKSGAFHLTEDEQKRIKPVDRMIFDGKFREGWDDWRCIEFGCGTDSHWIMIPPEHFTRESNISRMKASYCRVCLHCERVFQSYNNYQIHLKTQEHSLEYETEDENKEMAKEKLEKEIQSFFSDE